MLLSSAFGEVLSLWVGLDLVCPCLVIWLALFSISRLLFLMLGGNKVARGGPLLDANGSLQLRNSSHVRERD